MVKSVQLKQYWARIVAVSVVLLLGTATAAVAHTNLQETEPTAGAEVVAPERVILTFTDDILQMGTEIIITDSANNITPLTPEYPAVNAVMAALPELAPGAVQVSWRIVAADGHPQEGTYQFVVQGDNSSTPSAPPPETPIIADAGNSAANADDAEVTPIASTSGSSNVWVYLLIGLAVAAVVVVAVWKFRKSD